MMDIRDSLSDLEWSLIELSFRSLENENYLIGKYIQTTSRPLDRELYHDSLLSYFS